MQHPLNPARNRAHRTLPPFSILHSSFSILFLLSACTVSPADTNVFLDVTTPAGSITISSLGAPAAPVIAGVAEADVLYATATAGNITWSAPGGETTTATLDGAPVTSPLSIATGISNGTKNGMNHTLVVTATNSGGLTTRTTVNFSLISAITLFATASGHNGNLKGSYSTARIGADALCAADRSAQIGAASSCTSVRAFLSLTSSDTIAAMTTNYGVPSTLPIKSASFVTVGNNWADLLDASIGAQMDNLAGGANVVTSTYWTFSSVNGDLDATASPGPYHCSGGTSNSGSVGGETGADVSKLAAWLASAPVACSESHYVVCVCY